MGFLDDAKKKLTDAAEQHGDKINEGIDKAAGFVNEKTGGKHADKIDGATYKAKDALNKLDDNRGEPGGDATR